MNQEMFARIANAAVGAFKSAIALFERVLNQALEKIPYRQIPASNSPMNAIHQAQSSQKQRGDTHLTVDQLILGILEDPQIGYLFEEVGISASRLGSEVEKVRGKEGKKVENASCDTNFQAGKIGPAIGWDKEIWNVVRILSCWTKNIPVLIGEPGVCRTAVIEGLAQRIVRGDVPSKLADVRLIALVAGAEYRREYEERWNAVLKEIEDADGKVILFIDEIHLAVGSCRTEGFMYAANLFMPMLARGQLRCIGATTLEDYRKYVEKDAAFKRRVQPVYVAEPSGSDAISILRGLKERFEGHHGVRIQDRALVVAAQLSSRYITGRHLADKAIDLVDEACANVRFQLDSQPEENLMLTENVGPNQIAEVVSLRTGISVTKLGHNNKESLIDLTERLHKRVIGQDQAVDVVAKTILRSRAGFVRPQQPIGSLLFLGPNGVGKTELAKALVEQLFGDETLIVQIDMSEYMEQHSVDCLFGVSQRYVGHEKDGHLIGAVWRRSYSVVLFDKVEKAHASIFNTLLKVLDDGKLIDGQGRTVDFSNTIIIMTSDLGAEHLLVGMLGNSSMKIARERVMDEVRRHFKPKLLSRLDEIVIFDPLSHDQLRKVARLQIKDVAARFFKRGITLGVTYAALDIVVSESYDLIFGARPIRRLLEKMVVTDELSIMLIREEIDENSTVYIDVVPGKKELSYRVEKNGGMMNAFTEQKFDILIQIPDTVTVSNNAI